MAKQHIYANVKCGLYTKNSGFDTALVSNGLDEDYVKQNIHRFCFYNSHNFSDDEKNIMPPVYFCSHINSNSGNRKHVIFGKNIFVQASRNSFLSHSLIVSDEEEIEYLYKNYDRVINYDNFLDNADLEILENVDLKYKEEIDLYYNRDLLFECLGITKEIYTCILHYSILSAIEKKRVFIKLNCKRVFCSELAKTLLYFIFENIPYSIVKSISYITYTPSLSLSNFFNIVFVDKKVSLKDFDKGYVIDLTEPFEFYTKQTYLDFAWKNITHINRMLLQYGTYKNTDIKLDLNETVHNLNESVEKDKQNFLNLLLKNIGNKEVLFRSKDSYFFYAIVLIELYGVDKITSNQFETLKNSLLESKKSFLSLFPYKTAIFHLNNLLFNYCEKNTDYAMCGELFFIYECVDDIYLYIKNKINETTTYITFITKSYFYLNIINNYYNNSSYSHINKKVKDTIMLKSNDFKQSDLKDSDIEDLNTFKKKILCFEILGEKI